MNKKSVLTLISFVLTLALTGCNQISSSTNESSSQTGQETTYQTSDTQSTSSSSIGKVEFIDDLEIPEDDKISDMSLSGVFLDIEIGSHLVVGKEYSINLSSLPSSFKGSPVFVISDQSVMSIELISGTSYKLVGLKEGGAILIIKDEDDIYYYRNAINFRNKKTVLETLSYATNDVNYYASCYSSTSYNNYKIMFDSFALKDDQITGSAVLEATEDGVYYGYMTLSLTYEYEIDSGDYNEYSFSIVYAADDQSNPLQPSYLNISTVCDIIHLGSNNGLYDFFMPVFVS